MKGILTYIITGIICAVIGHLATPKVPELHKAAIEKMKFIFNHEIDSMEIVHTVQIRCSQDERVLRDSLASEIRMREFWHKETVRLRRILDKN